MLDRPTTPAPGGVNFARPRAHTWALCLVSLLVPAACDRGAPAGPTPSIDQLLQAGAELRVQRHPETALPPQLASALRSGDTQWSLSPDAWQQLTAAEIHADIQPLLIHISDAFGEGLGERVRVWGAQPDLPELLRLGRRWMTHEERAVSSLRAFANPIGGTVAREPWLDGEGGAVFLWDEARERLLALRSTRPGWIRYGLVIDESSPLARFERRLTAGAPAPRDIDGLTTRLKLKSVTRDAALAPAGTQLAIARARLPPGPCELALAVGVSELSEGSSVARPDAPLTRSDGVEFRVIHHTARADELLWSRVVVPDDGWVEAVVPLPAETQGELRLITDAGPAGDADFDFSAWADLRILPSERVAPTRPHVILIDVDTLRADRQGCYGYDVPTSPRLDAWAAEHAELFDSASSTSNWTLPATLSMLTGLEVAQHGVTDVTRALSLQASTLAEHLAHAGYDTWARTDGGYLVPTFGFDRGFLLFDVYRPDERERMAKGWEAELQRLATRRSDRPVFYFLQTYQVHTPFPSDRRFDDPASPYEGRFLREDFDHLLVQNPTVRGAPPDARELLWIDAQYDAAVRRMDDVVGAFLEGLPAALNHEPTLVILTSDHGEEVFDRDWYGHRHSLHEELLHVPLLVQHPGGERVGRSTRPASIIDVVPTVLDYAGIEMPELLGGHSLRGSLPATRLLIASHEALTWSARMDGRKLIATHDDPSQALQPVAVYDLDADPREQHDLSQQGEDIDARLLELLTQTLERLSARGHDDDIPPELDEDLLNDLEALGYLERNH